MTRDTKGPAGPLFFLLLREKSNRWASHSGINKAHTSLGAAMSMVTLSSEDFYLSSDGQFVLLDIVPLAEKIDAQQLGHLFAHTEWSTWQVSDKALQDAVTALNKANENDSHSVQIIARRINGEVKVVVNRDHMSATANVTAPWGGDPVTITDVQSALSVAGVVRGADEEAIRRLVRQASGARAGVLSSAIVAQGCLPEDGEDSRFERLVPTLAERVLQPRVTDAQHDIVDLRELGSFATVGLGDVLMRRHPPTLGTPGYKVTGEVLPAHDGTVLPFETGDGAGISPLDADCLIAMRDGLPQQVGHGMAVDQILAIKDVDAKFGHVDFSGSISIRGNVCDGMRVRAGGSIFVAGVVDSATIDAGMDVIVDKGIIGHPRQHGQGSSCQVRAGGKVVAKFAQYAAIHAGGDVHLTSQLLQTEVITPAAVIVADEGRRKGTLLGGHIEAGTFIMAVIMGGVADNSTRLVIPGDSARWQNERRALLEQQASAQAVIQQLAEAGSKLLLMADSSRRQELAARLLHTRDHQRQVIQAVVAALAQIEQQEAAFLASAKIFCCRQLYAGVTVDINGFHLLVAEDHPQCQIHHQEGILAILPLEAQP